MKIRLRPLEYILHAYMLVLLSSGFLPLLQLMRTGSAADLVEGDPLTRFLLLLGYGLSLPFLLIKPRQALHELAGAPWVWALIGFAVLSLFWSQLPLLTLRRSVATLLAALYALILIQRFTLAESLKLFGWVFMLMMIASLLMIIFLPDWGIMKEPHPGAWQGIFTHKNVLGRITILSLLIFIILFFSERSIQRLFWGVGIGITVVILLGSRSSTALVLTFTVILAIAIAPLLTPLNKRSNFLSLLLVCIFGLLSLWILFYTYIDILSLLGKDPTLTGRIILWENSLRLGFERPWIGWGFGTFWLGWQGPSAQIWSAVLWEPPHGHNGYLDLFLQLGFVGLFLGLALFYQSGKQLAKAFWRYKINWQVSFLFGLWVLLLVYNMNESAFLRQNNILWTMLVWLSFSANKMWLYEQ